METSLSYLFQACYITSGVVMLFYALYWLFLMLVPLIKSRKKTTPLGEVAIQKLLILLPAYKPNERLLEALAAIGQAKKPCPIEVVVLLQKSTKTFRKKLAKWPITVLEKDFDHVTGNPYHAALRFAANFAAENQASHLLLLDKDNLIRHDFIEQIMENGNPQADVWQGKRLALEQQGVWNTYDALAEALNDSQLRLSKHCLGLPPELSGSGLLFKKEAFFQAVHALDSRAPGMDKNLMIQLLLKKYHIDYVPSAVLHEEKTADLLVLRNQRKRWFGNQYFNAWYWGGKLLRKGSWATIDYAITLFRPPRSIQVVILPFLALLEMFFLRTFGLFSLATFFTISAVCLFLFQQHAWKKAWQIAAKLPQLALYNLLSAWKGSSTSQQGKFISTER